MKRFIIIPSKELYKSTFGKTLLIPNINLATTFAFCHFNGGFYRTSNNEIVRPLGMTVGKGEKYKWMAFHFPFIFFTVMKFED